MMDTTNGTPSVAFTTNICAHYRVKTFETLAHYHDVDYYFFSAGDEWYWQQQHGTQTGNFSCVYLSGVRLGQTRITPTLLWKLWQGKYDVYTKCINGRFALPVTYAVARLRRKPFVLWTGIWVRLQTRAHRLFFPITRYIYRHADAIVVYGDHVKQYLISEGVAAERIFVAAHAVDNAVYSRSVSDTELESLRQQLHISAHHKVILYVGRLEEVKGLKYLIEAFAACNRDDTVLVFAGTGSAEIELNELVREKGLSDRVRFVGYTPVAQTVIYYALAWVCVLPSVTVPAGKELWGLVVNEAFNQGVPVIATDAVGAAAGGLVHDGINGFVVPERDSTALARALADILDSPSLRAQMSQQARQIIAGWDNERMVQGFRQAIEYVQGR